MEHRLVLTDAPSDDVRQKLSDQLSAFNQAAAGPELPRPLAVLVMRQSGDDPLGGLWGYTHAGVLFVSMLVLPADLRRRGFGRRLMAMAEEEAQGRGCITVWLDTYDFQARGFYERLGYEVFGTLEGNGPIYPRYFLRKALR